MFCPRDGDRCIALPDRHADYKQSGCVEKPDIRGVDYAWDFESSFVTSDNLLPRGVLMVLRVRFSRQHVQSVLPVEAHVSLYGHILFKLKSSLCKTQLDL